MNKLENVERLYWIENGSCRGEMWMEIGTIKVSTYVAILKKLDEIYTNHKDDEDYDEMICDQVNAFEEEYEDFKGDALLPDRYFDPEMTYDKILNGLRDNGRYCIENEEWDVAFGITKEECLMAYSKIIEHCPGSWE